MFRKPKIPQWLAEHDALTEAEQSARMRISAAADRLRNEGIVEREQAEAIDQLVAERDRLQAIVAKLDRSADGEPITPDMMLYCPAGHETSETDGMRWCDQCVRKFGGQGVSYQNAQCYSTPAAVVAAAVAAAKR